MNIKQIYHKNTYPLMNKAEITGVQPAVRTFFVYLFLQTMKTQIGRSR